MISISSTESDYMRSENDYKELAEYNEDEGLEILIASIKIFSLVAVFSLAIHFFN